MNRVVGFTIVTPSKIWKEFGYSESLYSWFSTICYLLENNIWGSKYPLVMKKFYFDENEGIPYNIHQEFRKELKNIENKFKTIDSKKAIWSCEDKIYSIPKNMPNIDYYAKTLDKLYITKRGNKTLFELLYECIDSMEFWYQEDGQADLIIEVEYP